MWCSLRAFALVCFTAPVLAHALTADQYELVLRPDFAARVLEGHARIRLIADGRPAPLLAMPSPNLQITGAALNGQALAFEKTSTGWQFAIGEVTDGAALGDAGAPREPISAQWLELDYRAPAAAGLVFGDQLVYTAFQTCQWMPCIGSDLSRATIGISLALPPGQRSVASGRAIERTGDRRQSQPQQHWQEDRPYPLYTFGFAAGAFSEATDPADDRLRYLGANASSTAIQETFRDSARMLAFLEDKAGLPLPGPQYTQVLVPGNVAQEVSSFSVIGERTLADPQDDWVVVHEMAHQWWGNLVTCATWNEFWLNEGIAVFMTAAWKQQRWGEDDYRREIGAARERWQRAAEAGFDKPLNWSGEYPNLRTRRDVQYGKAAVFLHTLREALGERAFWDGLRRYTRDNAGRAVRAGNLRSAMEAAAGRSLQALFSQWVN